jgi:hypothetical protein
MPASTAETIAVIPQIAMYRTVIVAASTLGRVVARQCGKNKHRVPQADRFPDLLPVNPYSPGFLDSLTKFSPKQGASPIAAA